MEMRRKDRKLSEEETVQLLKECEYGVLSTMSEDGTPYGLPISFAYKDGVIYMHGARAEGHKIVNIKDCARASFTVVDHTEVLPQSFATKYMSAIAFGNVSIVENEVEMRKGMEAILHKYSSDFLESGMKYIDKAIDKIYVLKFEIDELSGKGRKK